VAGVSPAIFCIAVRLFCRSAAEAVAAATAVVAAVVDCGRINLPKVADSVLAAEGRGAEPGKRSIKARVRPKMGDLVIRGIGCRVCDP